MADKYQLDLLKKGVVPWNTWKKKHSASEITLTKANLSNNDLRGVDLAGVDLSQADLRGADLSQACLRGANLSEAYLAEAYLIQTDLRKASFRKADLHEANLSKADLRHADLRHANLSETNLSVATLRQADLSKANLSYAYLRGANLCKAKLNSTNLRSANLSETMLNGTDLSEADLIRATLRGANMRGADLRRSNFSETDLTRADLTECAIHSISSWGIQLKGARQTNLVITRVGEPPILVDTFKMAQFVAFLLDHDDLRAAIPTLETNIFLIIGSFGQRCAHALEPLKDALRAQNYIPVVVDCSQSSNRTQAETINILAQFAHCLIVDLTRAPHLLRILKRPEQAWHTPILPILSSTEQPGAESAKELNAPSMLPLYHYDEQTPWPQLLRERALITEERKVLV